MNAALRALERRWNAQSYEMLCQEITRLDAEREALAAENEELRKRLSWAEDAAEQWREDAISAMNEAAERTGGEPGLTIDGRLVVCMPSGAPA